MVTIRKTYQRWPKWLRILFSTFGFLFISLIIINIVRAISGPDFIEDNGPTLVLLAEVLVFVLTFQAISLTLKKEISFTSVATSIFYALAGIFLVFILEGFRWVMFDYYWLRVEVGALTGYAKRLEETIHELDPTNSLPSIVYPVSSPPTEDIILIITAISGLITAITGLFGQIISARKIKGELDVAKQQLLLEQKKIELEASKQKKEK